MSMLRLEFTWEASWLFVKLSTTTCIRNEGCVTDAYYVLMMAPETQGIPELRPTERASIRENELLTQTLAKELSRIHNILLG